MPVSNPTIMDTIKVIIDIINAQNSTPLPNSEGMGAIVGQVNYQLNRAKRCDHVAATKKDRVAFEKYPEKVGETLSFYASSTGQESLSSDDKKFEMKNDRYTHVLAAFTISLVELEDMIQNYVDDDKTPGCTLVMTCQLRSDFMIAMALLFRMFYDHFDWKDKATLTLVIEKHHEGGFEPEINHKRYIELSERLRDFEGVVVKEVDDLRLGTLYPYYHHQLDTYRALLLLTADYEAFHSWYRFRYACFAQDKYRVNLLTDTCWGADPDLIEKMATAGSILVEAFPYAGPSEHSFRLSSPYITKNEVRPTKSGVLEKPWPLTSYLDWFDAMTRRLSEDEQCYDCTIARYVGTLLDVAVNGKDKCADKMYNDAAGAEE